MYRFLGLSLLLIITSCGSNSYQEVLPGLFMKKIQEGKGRISSSSSDFFLIDGKIATHPDTFLPDSVFPSAFQVVIQSSNPRFSQDFTRTLHLVREGDSIIYRMPADSFFAHYYNIPKPPAWNSDELALHVNIRQIMSSDEYLLKLEDKKNEWKDKAYQEFESYLKSHNIQGETKGTGSLRVWKNRGSGAEVQPGDLIKIHFKQFLLDGTVTDDTYALGSPVEYLIGDSDGLIGLNEVLPGCRVGDKITAYMPYFVAFGEKGARPRIPPYSNLIMDIEIVEKLKNE